MDLSNTALALFPLLLPAYLASQLPNDDPSLVSVRSQILIIVVLSGVSFAWTTWLVPQIAPFFLKIKHFGFDINKKGTPGGLRKIPESLGIVPAFVFIVAITCCMLFYVENMQRLVQYNAALMSICFIVLLGFVDDMIDLKWRYKICLPFVASFPLLTVYAATGGSTWIGVPPPLSDMIGRTSIYLGPLYYLYMMLLAVFATNSINIFAGINGLECGQSFVVAVAVVTYNLIELCYGPESTHSNHVFSLFLMLPFIAVTLGLLQHNWFPSKVFVGDTYTLFAGMSLAVVGILGHFSKTLILFFVPQIFNFLYSIPQLFNLWGYTCPRHRLPKLNQATMTLKPTNDLNLVNLFLRQFGSTDERSLCVRLLGFQSVCCIAALGIRYSALRVLFE